MIEFKVGDVTTGITKDGKVIEISIYMNWILVINEELVSIEIPDGVRKVQCYNNLFKSLDIPESVHTLQCDKELFDYDKCKVESVRIEYEL